jgi:hypothetical protein
MEDHLVLRGEAHPVIWGQILGRCIRHAALLRAPLRSILAIVVSVIEPPLGTLLVTAACSPLLSGSHERRARLWAVPPPAVTAAAQHEAAAATGAASLDADREHSRTNSEELAATRARTILRTPVLRISTNALAAT